MNLTEALPIVGLAYVHYRDSSVQYVVQGFATDTSTESVVVLYRSLADREQLFTRPLTGPGGWLTPVRTPGTNSFRPRFTTLRGSPWQPCVYELAEGKVLRQAEDEPLPAFCDRVRAAGGNPPW